MKQVKIFNIILLGAGMAHAFAADDSLSASITASPGTKAQPRTRRAFDASAFLTPAAKVSGAALAPVSAEREAVIAPVDGQPTAEIARDGSSPAKSRTRRVFDASAFLTPAAKVPGAALAPSRDGDEVAAVAPVVGDDAADARQSRAAFDASAFLAAAADPFTPQSPSKLGGGKVNSPSKLKDAGVYATPLMSKWMDAAQTDTDLVGLTAQEAGEILKYFASYLDKVKRRAGDIHETKGPYTGILGSRTYLSEVDAMQRKLAANPEDASVLAEVVKFINKKKSSFFNSLKSQKMVD